VIERKKDDENVSAKRLCDNCKTELKLIIENNTFSWFCETCETSETIRTIKRSL
jgi:hypothetical protein